MKQRIFIVFALLFVISISSIDAQKANINFDKKAHDFGEIAEKGGPAVHIFEFTNTGNAPLVLQRVSASCGCTTPEWTKTPIEPGKKGTIKVSYNPLGRPGRFSKLVSVYSNATNEMERLTISGNVAKESNTSNSAKSINSYPVRIGELGLKSKAVRFNNVDKKEVKSQSIDVINTTSSNLAVSLHEIPSYLNASVTPKVIKAGEVAKIEVSFDASKCSEWGPVETKIYIGLNGKFEKDDATALNISANVIEDFSKMGASEKRNAPILEVKSFNLSLGDIKKGNRVRGKINLKNAGNSSLDVRRIINNNSDIFITPMRTSIKSGKSEQLKIEIDSKFLPQGEYKKIFTMQTNDPINPIVTFNVSFKVL